MSKRKILTGYSVFAIFLLFLLFFTVLSVDALPGQVQISQTPTPTLLTTPTSANGARISIIESNILKNDSQIEILESKIQNLETSIQVQSEAYSATVSRMEANMNLLLAVMTIASILIAVLGFGFVKFWIKQLVEERVKNALSQEIKDLAKVEMENIRKEWDPKFASLYDEYRKAIPRK